MNRLLFNISFLLIFCPLAMLAQNSQAVRLEVPSNIDIESYHVEALSTDGVLVFYESSEVTKDDKRKWYFALFNTSLAQEWLKFVDLTDRIEFIEAKQSNRKLHLLFKSTTQSRSSSGFYEIVTYDFRTQDFSLISGAIPQKAEVAGFDIIGRTACLGLNLKKNLTDVLFINLTNGDIHPVHLMPESQNRIMHIQSDPLNKRINVVLKLTKDKRYLTDHIISFSEKGEQLQTIEVQNENNSKLLSSYIIKSSRGKKLELFGTFDLIKGRMAGLKDLDDDDNARGAGFYFFRFDNDEQILTQYYDFINFENIHASLVGREVKSSRKSENDSKSNTGKKFTAYYYMYEPQLLELDDEYILSVELYSPHYRTETRMDYDFYGRPYPSTYSVFDGYEFYDVVVAGIDKNGELQWNNDFGIRNIKTYNLQRHSIVLEDEGFVTIAYVNNGDVISQTIQQTRDITGDEVSIEGRFTRDRTVRDENNHIIGWYGNYMLIYGYQQINNRSLGDQSERTVFYVSKVAYQ